MERIQLHHLPTGGGITIPAELRQMAVLAFAAAGAAPRAGWAASFLALTLDVDAANAAALAASASIGGGYVQTIDARETPEGTVYIYGEGRSRVTLLVQPDQSSVLTITGPIGSAALERVVGASKALHAHLGDGLGEFSRVVWRVTDPAAEEAGKTSPNETFEDEEG